MMEQILIRKAWAMPNRDTFSIPPVREFVESRIRNSLRSIDPFARNSGLCTFTNDINPETSAMFHEDAESFLSRFSDNDLKFDLVILDPPYSPRQVKEAYDEVGKKTTKIDCQQPASMKRIRGLINKITRHGAVCLSFGWNSVGMGSGWVQEEILLVCHGGYHHDTICTASRKVENGETFEAEI